MNVHQFLLLLFMICFFPLSAAGAETDWSRIEAEIIEQSRKTREAAQYTVRLVKMDRSELKQELSDLEKKLKEVEKTYESRQQKFDSLLERQSALQEKIESEKEEIQNVEDVVFNAALKTRSLISQSPITPELTGRIKTLEPLTSNSRFPGMEGVRSLVDIIWSEMAASGDVRKYEGTFTDRDFKKEKGEVVRVGSLCAAYQSENGDAGYLQVGANNEFNAVPADLSWFVRRSLSDFISGESDHMPVDVSGGSVFKVLSDKKGFTDWIESGGLLIWPIFIVAAAALLLGLERFIFLFRIRFNSDKIMKEIQGYIEQNNWDGARQYCKKNKRFPTCNVMGAVFDHLGVTRDVMENAIQEAMLRQIPRLERFVATLAILAAIAPLLGLLGTVTGMINTFQIITLFGTGDPKLMSGGISEALVTTQLGLAVAIPIMLMHHFLERRVDKMLGDIEEKGNQITLTLVKKGVITKGVEEVAG